MDKLFSVNFDKNDYISTLAFLHENYENLVLKNDFEAYSGYIYVCLKEINYMDSLESIINMIECIKNKKYFIIHKFKIFTHNSWGSSIATLYTIKNNLKLLKISNYNQLEQILKVSIKLYNPIIKKSLFILKLIKTIVDKTTCIFNNLLSSLLLNFTSLVALSPIKGFKQYAEDISKKLLSNTSNINNLDLNMLPLKGIAVTNLSFIIKKMPINKINEKIIKMFANNIESREGAILYKILLNIFKIDFKTWQEKVWPNFLIKFLDIDYESEFFQSLLKYWIPYSVMNYQQQLYKFILDAPIALILKGYILLETRKKGFLNTFNNDDMEFVLRLFANEATSFTAFQIISISYSTKDTDPSDNIFRIKLFKEYLDEKNDILDNKERKILQDFLHHFFMLGKMKKNNQKDLLDKFLISLFNYSVNLLKTERKCLGAQILYAFFIESKNNYENFANALNSLNDEKFKHLLETTFSICCEDELKQLALICIEEPKIINNNYLLNFIEEISDQLSIKTANFVNNLAEFLKKKNNNKNNKTIIVKILLKLKGLLIEDVQLKDIFKAALLINCLMHFIEDDEFNEDDSSWLWIDCFNIIAEMTQFQSHTNENKNKKLKIIEALYNNLCSLLMKCEKIPKLVNCSSIMKMIVKVIEKSSLRKPTMSSASLLKHILNLNNNDEDIKLMLLNETIEKLRNATSVQNLTIRRNPEIRLILHALCIADKTVNKSYLKIIFKDLIEILSDSNSCDATIAATLHSIEILMLDNTLYGNTLLYSQEIILKCIQHFANRNWIVRNANIQLLKALIDRFLGVQIGHNSRNKSIEDLFMIFPQLVKEFFKFLTKSELTDSVLAIFQFFSESQLKAHPFQNEFTKIYREIFLKIFIKIIKTHSNFYAIFAIRAYVSLCYEEEIPKIIKDIVCYIIDNWSLVRKNHLIGNFKFLLQELCEKYDSLENNLENIHTDLNVLTKFLRNFNLQQFDLLLFPVLNCDKALKSLKESVSDDYKFRIRLHNYIPYILANFSSGNLSNILEIILNKNTPECLHIKALTLLLNNSLENEDILNILILKIFTLSSNYLLLCYFKIIHYLLLYKNWSISNELFKLIPQYYNNNNFNYRYQSFVCVLILSKKTDKSDEDNKFLRNILKNLEKFNYSNNDDEDFIDSVSAILQFLYLNISCTCDKKRLLYIALKLLITYEKWNFISFLKQSPIPNAINALKFTLNYNFLQKFIQNYAFTLYNNSDAFLFVNNLYEQRSLLLHLNHMENNNSTTFYEIEKYEFVIPPDLFDKIILEFLYEFCKLTN